MTAVTRPLHLPAPLRGRVAERVAHMLTPKGATIDFTRPQGEEALAPPDSVSWRIFKNPVSLFIGGVAAVLLEFGEPRVRDGVWQNTSFRRDAFARLQRTGYAAMVTVYGARSDSERMIARVRAMHERISGVTSEGEPYAANDPELLEWVQATASYGFIEAYHRYVAPLSPEEKDSAYAEAVNAARLYGVAEPLTSAAQCEALFNAKRNRLQPSPIVHEFLGIMRKIRIDGIHAGPVQHALLKGAVEILPDWVRQRLDLGEEWCLNMLERGFISGIAKVSDRLVIPTYPAVQACRRLGLPDCYLFARRSVSAP
ncbi:oxygenase MpaB family protein [Oricola nitratireducens]|uniref:oxygenase MpaB family protein n=1 Tax=Oricola nitratireducens TaxID=2775868 RepID=UPI001867784F